MNRDVITENKVKFIIDKMISQLKLRGIDASKNRDLFLKELDGAPKTEINKLYIKYSQEE